MIRAIILAVTVSVSIWVGSQLIDSVKTSVAVKHAEISNITNVR